MPKFNKHDKIFDKYFLILFSLVTFFEHSFLFITSISLYKIPIEKQKMLIMITLKQPRTIIFEILFIIVLTPAKEAIIVTISKIQ